MERPVSPGGGLAGSLLASVAAAVMGLVCVCGCGKGAATAPAVKTSVAEPVPGGAVLVGRWLRPDGGYVLEIAAVAGDGALKASYFNPASIHVAKAQVSRGNGRLRVFIELRDVNYPGSTYHLTYDPAADQLKGSYYQAVAKETYEIFFVRENTVRGTRKEGDQP